MFGFKLIKTKEFENLKADLAAANDACDAYVKRIDELLNIIEEQKVVITNLTESTEVNKTESTEEKPVKKVRRKSTKKTTKKED